MAVVVTGSVAYDYIMSFPGHFKDHILMDKINTVSLSFLVDSMRRERGGCAANIAYNLALLGERPKVMGTVGQDFADYRAWLEAHNVDTSTIVTIDDDFTASFFCSTDQDNCQIANFYTGAMSKACQLSFEGQECDFHRPRRDLPERPCGNGEVRSRMWRSGHTVHVRSQPADRPAG